MSLKADLYQYISTEASMTALIGTNIASDYMDQKQARPYITFQEVSNEGVEHFTGVPSLDNSTIQFKIYADTPESRTAVETALRTLLNGHRGELFVGSTFINRIFNTTNFDNIEFPDDGSQNAVYVKLMDFDIWHER